MSKTYCILYNPKANNGAGEKAARNLGSVLQSDSLHFEDITGVKDYYDFFHALPTQEKLVIAGGDGTLNRFVNETDGIRDSRPIWYYPTGSGNDFWKDIGQKAGGKPANISQYLVSLPRVTVRGETRLFLNGVGYGIDGYCCEVGDQLRKTSKNAINYTDIAVKGLLFHYHPTEATVIADGHTQIFQKVWLAPTMLGRYYGGGMMPTPAQRRLAPNPSVSCMVMHGSDRLKTLAVFPSIFKGEHVRHTGMVTVIEGHEITVLFDRPTALQIDGETVLNVSEYTVHAPGKRGMNGRHCA